MLLWMVKPCAVQQKKGSQVLTAYCTESSVVLGQEAIHEKTNEIPVFQEMLEYIDIKGKTVTADAMHCQKETCRKIKEKRRGLCPGA
ncbi:MAG: transposase [Lachnospiraceae bacterium]|nr:transposase [Lachnospiraceae bacterium]